MLLNDQILPEFKYKIQAVCRVPIYEYGFKESSDIRICNSVVVVEEDMQKFDISFFGNIYKDFKIRLFGKYNLENAATAIAIGLKENIDVPSIRSAISSFRGTEQRQQIKYHDHGVILIEDFAHHPTAVRCTITGVRERYPTKRLIAVFEPRSATSRRKDFEIPYSTAFDEADIAVIAKPTLRSVDDISKIMDVDIVVNLIKERMPAAFSFGSIDEIRDFLEDTISSNDVVLIMSNGHFDGLTGKITQFLIDTHTNTGDNRGIIT